MPTSRCDYTTHYGCLGPRWASEPDGEQAGTGECGRITSNSGSFCDEHEADWNANHPNHPPKGRSE